MAARQSATSQVAATVQDCAVLFVASVYPCLFMLEHTFLYRDASLTVWALALAASFFLAVGFTALLLVSGKGALGVDPASLAVRYTGELCTALAVGLVAHALCFVLVCYAPQKTVFAICLAALHPIMYAIAGAYVVLAVSRIRASLDGARWRTGLPSLFLCVSSFGGFAYGYFVVLRPMTPTAAAYVSIVAHLLTAAVVAVLVKKEIVVVEMRAVSQDASATSTELVDLKGAALAPEVLV